MGQVTAITFENFKHFIGRRVQVEICCYGGGMCYPDNNILLGMSEENYYFLSDGGAEDECYWHWQAKDDKREYGKVSCSVQVWDYEELQAYYSTGAGSESL